MTCQYCDKNRAEDENGAPTCCTRAMLDFSDEWFQDTGESYYAGFLDHPDTGPDDAREAFSRAFPFRDF